MASNSSGFNPLSLLTAPITGAFQYAGAKQQAAAQTHAADLQAQAAQNALDYTKSVKAAQTAAAAPYQALGTQATGMLPGAVRPTPLGAGPTPYSTRPNNGVAAPQGAPLSQIGQPATTPTVAPPQAAAGGPMVTLQAPDGQTKQFSQADAQRILQIKDAQGRSARVIS